jgi:hypothetical protein
MKQHSESTASAGLLLLQLALFCLVLFISQGAQAYAGPASLRAKHDELREQLRDNSFRRALYIDSSEVEDTVKGDVYAVLDHPFTTVTGALKERRRSISKVASMPPPARSGRATTASPSRPCRSTPDALSCI